MKKILYVLVVIAIILASSASLTGCDSYIDAIARSYSMPDPSAAPAIHNQPLNFRNYEGLTDAQREKLQSMLNGLGSTVRGELHYNVIAAEYADGGGLRVFVFIRNGTGRILQEARLNPATVTLSDGRIVASANFNSMNIGPLLPSETVIWLLLFPSDTVLIRDADLSGVELLYITEYRW